MPAWPEYFVVVAAVAFVAQAAILLAILVHVKRSHQRMERIANDLHSRVKPILSRLELLVDEAQPRIVSMVTDASEVVHLARSQAQKVDRILTETLDRMRIQIIHADQILSGALETIEDTGSTFRRTLLGPIQQATAFVRGIKSGLEVLRSFRRPPSESGSASSDSSDESLFI